MQHARVQGKVEYRIGDGPKLVVPPGPIEVEVGSVDVTMHWASDNDRQSAAIPSGDFARYLDTKAIVPAERATT